MNVEGRTITYVLNYSSTVANAKYGGLPGHDILTGKTVSPGEALPISPWDLVIIMSGR